MRNLPSPTEPRNGRMGEAPNEPSMEGHLGRQEVLLMAGKNPQTIREVVAAKYTPVLLGRVSSSGQRKGLPSQMKFLREQASNYGFKPPFEELAVRQTGRAAELETLAFVQELRKQNPRKKFVAFFRDSTRIARDLENALALRRELSEIGIPIIALDLPELTGKKPL